MSTEESKPGDFRKDRAGERWRNKLLPAMRGALVFMGVFFFVASFVQYHLLYQDLRGMGPRSQAALEALANTLPQAEKTNFEVFRWKTLVLLEQDAMSMRHQHVNAALLLRTWTRYTGFLVGMVLALVGAFFILGRLKEEINRLSGDAGGLKFALVTSSPGVILTVLGTILMVVTLVVKVDFEVQDRPVYVALYLMKDSNGSKIAIHSAPPTPFPPDATGPSVGKDDIPKPPAVKPGN
jgi:hypothetical protein